MTAQARVCGTSLLLALIVAGCTGLSLGENRPGDDTYVEPGEPAATPGSTATGEIAVDPVSETAFVALKTRQHAQPYALVDTPVDQQLFAIHPDSGAVTLVADLRDRDDVRVLFPATSLLVMYERAGVDVLERRDRETFGILKQLQTFARYHGTRMSPSRRYIAVADNAASHAPVHIIEEETLRITRIPHDGQWLEAAWLNGRDTLVAIVFYDMFLPTARARILSWSLPTVSASEYAMGSNGFWEGADLDITVPGILPDYLFSFTWVGVSPDDRRVVFPVRERTGDQPRDWRYQLLVVDTATGELRRVDDAQGPVGFSPDGTTIVSYRNGTSAERPDLVLIDAGSLEAERAELPLYGNPHYFITREGNAVVVASTHNDESLLLYDLDRGGVTRVKGPAAGLDDFVSRVGHHELWLAGNGLDRLDLMTATLERMPLPFVTRHVNILPRRDRLVLGEGTSNRIHYFDPTTQELVRTVRLPRPGF